MKITSKLVQSEPVPLFFVVFESKDHHITLDESKLPEVLPDMQCSSFESFLFRSVSANRLKNVLKNGVDVLPPDSVIYAGSLSKALEYGDWPKVVMVLNPEFMERSYKIVESDCSQEVLQELMMIYPTKIESVDGSNYWLTRLDFDDTRAASSYEESYGYWIPDEPWNCLKMILLFARSGDDVANAFK